MRKRGAILRAVIAALAITVASCTAAAEGAFTQNPSVAEAPAAPTQITTTTHLDKTFVVLPADTAPPVYWAEFGQAFDTYYGIDALSNGKKKGNAAKYQCTELIHRYVSQVYGFPSRIGLGMGNGNMLAEGIATYFKGQSRSLESLDGREVVLEYFPSEESSYPPVVGSIISMHFTPDEAGFGHVAILRSLKTVSPRVLEGELFAQHGKMPYKIGAEVPADTVTFTQDGDGKWSGLVHSHFFKRDFRIVGWTTAVVAPWRLPKSR
jgi:hypothetical protein